MLDLQSLDNFIVVPTTRVYSDRRIEVGLPLMSVVVSLTVAVVEIPRYHAEP